VKSTPPAGIAIASKLRSNLGLSLGLSLLLLTLAGCGSGSDNPEATSTPTTSTSQASTPPKKSPPQQVTATLGLPLAQEGPDPAPASEATAPLIVNVTPAKAGFKGRPVELQSRHGDGDWETTDSGALDAKGSATLAAPADAGAEMRVIAAADGDYAQGESQTFKSNPAAWADEFDDGDMEANWAHRGQEYNPSGMRLCSKGDDSTVEGGDGTLELSVLDDPARDDLCTAKAGNGKSIGQYDYRLNANINSKALFRYGTFAARIKFQRGAGQHGAFWLQSSQAPGSGSPAEAGAEVDIVEFFGEHPKKKLASFIHYYPAAGAKPVKVGDWMPNPTSLLADADDDWWKNYHVFSLQWTPEEYVILVDGKVAWRTDQGVSQADQMMVLSLLSSDYELKNLDAELPQTMSVDWVKYWPYSG
jgi:beta-glucanase (GH16 family)